MDENYDVIVLGTGLKECVLSGIFSIDKKVVLHMDRNKYYGGESASLTPIDEFWKNFTPEKSAEEITEICKKYGKPRDWNIDTVPKLIMAKGKLTQLLIHTTTDKYLDFQLCDGSYVQKLANEKTGAGKLYKVPANAEEAIKSSLMGIFEKRKFRSFIMHVDQFEESDQKTWKGMDPYQMTMAQIFAHFNLDRNTQDFVGHALALYREDNYLKQPYLKTFLAIKLYQRSLDQYGKSPYLYPMYGLGELPQAFARLSAVYGGTYMLDKPIEELVMEDGKCVGVKSQGEIARAKMVVCDPSYALDRCKKVGEVVRAYCFLNHPIPNTNDANGVQIIIPQNQVVPKRKSDIYISMVSVTHNVSAKGYYIATCSTTVETATPKDELRPALDLLGPIMDKVYHVSPMYVPIDDGKESNIFISKSYDATSHFETTCEDIDNIYERAMGRRFDYSKVNVQKEEEQ